MARLREEGCAGRLVLPGRAGRADGSCVVEAARCATRGPSHAGDGGDGECGWVAQGASWHELLPVCMPMPMRGRALTPTDRLTSCCSLKRDDQPPAPAIAKPLLVRALSDRVLVDQQESKAGWSRAVVAERVGRSISMMRLFRPCYTRAILSPRIAVVAMAIKASMDQDLHATHT